MTENVRHFFPIVDSFFSLLIILNFIVLTWLDKNIIYFIVIAQFTIVFVGSTRIVTQTSMAWHSRFKRRSFIYFWTSL